MKKRTLIAGVLALVMIVCAAPQAAFAAPKYVYTANPLGYPWDVANTEYFAPVKSLMDRNIIMGNPDGYFYPERGISRAELAVMIAKITGNSRNKVADSNLDYFDDLAGFEWAKPYINACKRANLITGRSERIFDPKAQVSYVELMAIMARIQNPQINLGTNWPDNYINYSKTVMRGLIDDRNITDWNAPATRGDVAMILFKGASRQAKVELTWEEKKAKDELVNKLRLPEPAKAQ